MMARPPARWHSGRMPRQPRFFYPGAVLHVVQRGNDRAPVFARAEDYPFYLNCLLDAVRTHGVSIHAYVLMTNHVHLLLSPPTPTAIPRMMQSVGRRYVGRFNFLYGRTGTLWEGRYKATAVDSDHYLLACMRYIELNPVRACMVARPEHYQWSSFRANATGIYCPLLAAHPVYEALAGSRDARTAAYRSLFRAPVDEVTIASIRDATQFEWALGGPTFCEKVRALTHRRSERAPLGRRARG